MGLSKEICKRCRGEVWPQKPWGAREDRQWDRQRVRCPRSNGGFYATVSKKRVPRRCYYFLEQVVSQC